MDDLHRRRLLLAAAAVIVGNNLRRNERRRRRVWARDKTIYQYFHISLYVGKINPFRKFRIK
jgi:hypothetical protein